MATSKKARKNKIQTDPAFERTRENLAEFANAARSVKVLRETFRELMVQVADRQVVSRLTRIAMRVLHTDLVSDRGERTVAKGDCTLLQGFNFNSRSSLSDTLYVRPVISIDRASGLVTINVPAFVPRVRIQPPVTASHFQIMAAAAAIDFEKGNQEYAMQQTESLPLDKKLTSALTLSLQLPPGSHQPILVAIGVNFEQGVNNKLYALNNSGFNAAAIVQVDVPVITNA